MNNIPSLISRLAAIRPKPYQLVFFGYRFDTPISRKLSHLEKNTQNKFQ